MRPDAPSLSAADAVALVERMGNCRLWVVGDLMLDDYVRGDTARDGNQNYVKTIV